MRKPRGVAQCLGLTMLALAGLSWSSLPVATQSTVVVEARESNSDKSTRGGSWRNPGERARSMLAVNGRSSVAALPEPDESPAQVSAPGANGKIAFSRSLSISDVHVVNADGSNQKNLTNSQGFDGAPVWSPDGSRIAFESGRDGNGEIYVMNSDGSNPTRLTNDPAGDYGPVWSPDGSRIAFVSYRNDSQQIYAINADGSNLKQLTSPAPGGVDSPVWSPDGTRIAFIRYVNDGETHLIYVMNADGSNQRRLTDGPGRFEDSDPAWSPDGSRIAFARWQDSRRAIYVMTADGSYLTPLTGPYSGGAHRPVWSPDGRKIAFENEEYDYVYIYVMNADGSNRTRLTNEYSFSPVWSPDGSRIAFIQNDIYVMNADGSGQRRITNSTPGSYFDPPRWSPDGVRITFGRHINVQPDIYVMNADGGGLLRLTDHPAIDRHPAWSPDGSRIAFVSYRDVGSINIYVMNADGSRQTRLTSLPGFNVAPDWSPDGTRIVFAHSHNGNNAIYVMNADGSNLTRLTDPGTLYGSPAWSPDGARIAFARFQNGNQEIYVMNADGSGQINFTNSPGFDSEPAWSPDGSKIVFQSLQNPNTEIYVMNSDGSNQTRLTDNRPGFDGGPVWSPDGSRIAFMSNRGGLGHEIYVMNSDGGNPTRLTHNLDAYNLDPDWQALPFGVTNPIDDARFFVRHHYLDFLNREPDPGGLAYWTDRITQCGSDARCIHERRIGVSAAFFIELEFQDTGYYVYRFYKASFGRQPNYTEFNADRSKVVDGPNLETNKQALADEWVQRTAFTQAYPITMSNTEVVNKLFNTAGLTASIYEPQRQQEIAAMNAGRSRALVLRDVIEIPVFKNIPDPNDPRYSEFKELSQYNPAFVLMQYFGYLSRDVDTAGYDFWLDVVNNREPNNYHGMVCAFITSTEYQLRFASTATRSNADCAQ